MFQKVEDAVLMHEAPPGSRIHPDPAGMGWIVVGYTHAPYLVDWEGTVTPVTELTPKL